MNKDLVALGDSLERAIAIDIEVNRNTSTAARHVPVMLTHNETTTDNAPTQSRPARLRSRRILAIGSLAVLGIGGAAAAAAVTMSSDDVSHGLPGGSLIFQGTNPACTSTDGVVFDCTLASVPTQESMPDYTGAAELFVDKDLNIAGGCRGKGADGLEWTCYLGQRAVDEGILSADLLGQNSPSPGRG
jgi:hypothetical protein